ncbi:MAG TPA: hypothetical protein VMS93_12125 [Candidatus Saccharimonadales bacterium]|nr:hypothetical protein [Candidatus Saccharimonadales bacterium]
MRATLDTHRAALAAALLALLAAGPAWPGGARAIGRGVAAPDSAILARLRGAAEVRVCRLELAGEGRCRALPGSDSCLVGNRVRGWQPAPAGDWAARLAALLSDPRTYRPGMAPPRYTFAPEIGVQFRGPAGVCDVALCFDCDRLSMVSAPAPGAAADARYHGEFGQRDAAFTRLAKLAFPDDPEVQGWADSLQVPDSSAAAPQPRGAAPGVRREP